MSNAPDTPPEKPRAVDVALRLDTAVIDRIDYVIASLRGRAVVNRQDVIRGILIEHLPTIPEAP